MKLEKLGTLENEKRKGRIKWDRITKYLLKEKKVLKIKRDYKWGQTPFYDRIK